MTPGFIIVATRKDQALETTGWPRVAQPQYIGPFETERDAAVAASSHTYGNAMWAYEVALLRAPQVKSAAVSTADPEEKS